MADYTEFPENPQPGDIVEKNGRTWYYDSTKWVLFVDPKNTGDIRFDDELPIQVVRTDESTGQPDETRPVITTSIDLATLDMLDS